MAAAMTPCLLFLLLFAASGRVRADGIADFSNNLVSDLGPLIALFGEPMTRQFLSESTTLLDYFIFAMAPIGIITAMVSVIRVCGHSSLRAFIGRAQESDATREAELCTSTSRDVCELFTKGGIARVLGRPTLLELIHIPNARPNSKAGLFIFQHYLEEHPDIAWEPSESSQLWVKQQGLQFAPKPNLSLNIGIQKRSDWVFLAVAVVGFILQAGVLVLAGVGVWLPGWNLGGGTAPSSGSGNYAPIMFIAGTVLMCTGVWACAALIGQTTQEIFYRRVPCAVPLWEPRLIWLQPGPQVIGDQTFDPFVYFETEHDPLQIWTSSTKALNKTSAKKFELYTFIAVSAVLVGYVMQFIGQRGMSAWVSIAQLGVTVVMSILRGVLRMQRLDMGSNRLDPQHNTASGQEHNTDSGYEPSRYELDWLSFELSGLNSTSWKPQKLLRITGRKIDAAKVDKVDSANGMDQAKDPSSITTTLDHLLRIRVRLAQLTGHLSSFTQLDRSEYQVWKDEHVKVRAKSIQLSAAVSLAAASILEGPKAGKDIILRVEAALFSEKKAPEQPENKLQEQPINIRLQPPDQSSHGRWRVDSAQIEAILSLWMWSLQRNREIERVPWARIVSAGVEDCASIQLELDSHLSSNQINLFAANLHLAEDDTVDFDTRWILKEESWYPVGRSEAETGACSRFCGLNLVHSQLASVGTKRVSLRIANEATVPILFAQLPWANVSLLDLCTQELFALLMTSLVTLLRNDKLPAVESAGVVRVDDPTVKLVSAFVESSLGSRSDAILCIVPAIRKKLPEADPDNVLWAFMEAAAKCRHASEWLQANVILRWACEHFSSPRGGDSRDRLFARALREIGELYRRSLARPSGEGVEFGKNGVEWMSKTYGTMAERSREVADILNCYRDISQRTDSPTDPVDELLNLLEAGDAEKKTDVVYLLRFLTTDNIKSSWGSSILPLAARTGWDEVVDAILDLKPNLGGTVDSMDAVSWCARRGHDTCLKRLINAGASLEQQDSLRNRTTLTIAVEHGHENITKLLLEAGENINQRALDDMAPLHFAAKHGYGAIAQQLLENGADSNARDKFIRTPLFYAAKGGHFDTTLLLLQHGVAFDLKDNRLRTPLSYACAGGHQAIAELLLERGSELESTDDLGRTPLSYTSEAGHESLLLKLIYQGADWSLKDKDGRTPLFFVPANAGGLAVTQLLLARGADLKLRDTSDRTPLSHACERGADDVIKLLLDNDADANVNSRDKDGITPLGYAMFTCSDETVQCMFARGAADPHTVDKNGNMLLHYAAERNCRWMARILLNSGADRLAENWCGFTPLQMAYAFRNYAIARELEGYDGRTPLYYAGPIHVISGLLFEKSVDPDSRDDGGRTPLMEAVINKEITLAKLLLGRGVDIEWKDYRGVTALWYAALRVVWRPSEFEKDSTLTRLLLEMGADPNSRNTTGDTLLHLATRWENSTYSRLLLDHGADPLRTTDAGYFWLEREKKRWRLEEVAAEN